jgi:hypothetical protein
MIGATYIEAELGGDHDFAAERRKRLAHEFFVEEWAVDLGGIEEGDAAVNGGVEKIRHLLFVFGRAVGKAHALAAEAKGGNFQIIFSKFARLYRLRSLHRFSL